MANSNIASIGRFSSQMLTYLGTQKTVKSVNGTYVNTFKYSTGRTVFPDPDTLLQSYYGGGVVGSMPTAQYNSTKSYFLSRGGTEVYADTMTSLTLDIALVLGITPQELLEKSEYMSKLSLSANAYRMFNELRDPGNQVGVVTTALNRDSLQARQIRS